MSDNRKELQRAYEKFDIKVENEALCGLCGHFTFNPCETVNDSGWPLTQIETIIGIKRPGEVLADRKLALPRPAVIKSRAAYCFGARCFAKTLLTRRELRPAIEARLYAGLESGVTLHTHTGTPVDVSDDLVDMVFSNGVLFRSGIEPIRARPVEAPWDDEPTEEEAWASHWRSRSMRGKVRKAPSSRVALRVAMFLAALQMPSTGLDINDDLSSTKRKNIA